jgi:hypothetical protein
MVPGEPDRLEEELSDLESLGSSSSLSVSSALLKENE